MKKALISVTGLDTTGIIARVATKLYEMNINILDITQTILGGYFTMMMVVDLDGAERSFEEINKELEPVTGTRTNARSVFMKRSAGQPRILSEPAKRSKRNSASRL